MHAELQIKGNGVVQHDIPVEFDGLDLVLGPADVVLDSKPYSVAQVRERILVSQEFSTRVDAYVVVTSEGVATFLVDETVQDEIDVRYIPHAGPGMRFTSAQIFLSMNVDAGAGSLENMPYTRWVAR